MERFCNKCGSLVSGDGVFCPNCGDRLESAVSLEKPSAPAVEPMMPSAPLNNGYSATNMNNSYSATNLNNPTGTYQGQTPNYVQPIINNNFTMPSQEMSVGQWMLTIFLSGLGVIGLILLFVWAFGSDTPVSKRNYAKAMLIYYAIAVGLTIIFYVGLFMCAGLAAGGFEEIFENLSFNTWFM